MTRVIILSAAMFLAGMSAANGQGSIGRVLGEIEANNLALRAKASYTEAGQLAERVGNSLPDPEVNYEHTWGNPSELGKQTEFTATQSFDFPSAYAARNRLARLRGKQYASEYDLYRQQILIEAYETCMEIISLRRQRALIDTRLRLAAGIAEVSEKMLEAGEANAMRASRARMQRLTVENRLREIDMDIADALGRLQGLNGGTGIDFPDAEFPPATGIMPFDEMLAIYNESDPALLSALAGRDAAGQEVRASRSASLPKLSFGYKFENDSRDHFRGLAAGMSIPVFGNRNNVKRARALERYAELQAAGTAMSVEQQLRTLYVRAGLLEESVRACDGIAEEASEYMNNLSKALEAGQITVTDFFSQYDAITEFEDGVIDIMKEYHIVRARIYSVMM